MTTPDDVAMVRHKGRLTNGILLVLFAIVLLSGTYLVLGQMHDAEIRRAEAGITWKSQEAAWDIAQFMQERARDAQVTAAQRGLPTRVLAYRQGTDATARDFVLNRLEIETEYHGYDSVVVFDSQGAQIISAGDPVAEHPSLADHVRQAVATGEEVFVEPASEEESSWIVWWLCPMSSVEGETFVYGEAIDIAPLILDVIERHQASLTQGDIVVLDEESDGVVRSVCSEDGVSVVGVDECQGMRRAALGPLGDDRMEVVNSEDCKSGPGIGAVVEVEGTDWRVLTKVPRSSVVDPIRDSHVLALAVDMMLFAVFGLTVVSLQRARERRAEQAQSLVEIRQALAAQDRFLANMSHELRTPLNSIMGFTSIMLGGMAGPLSAEQRKQLSMVDESAKRLLALVNDVLDLSKLKAGKRHVVVSGFGVGDVVADVCGIMHPLSERKDLKCTFDVPEEDVEMHTDREMVERVVLNLLSNAIKFTEKGFVRLDVGHDREKDEVRFVVSDSGCGVPEAELGRVMEEFTQVIDPSGIKPVGTGLGLAISRRMAEALGGTLHAESQEGDGSTFTFVIPRAYQGDGEADL